MKLSLLLIMLACFKVSASVYAQSISLNERNAPLTKVFRLIEQQSGYSFFYKNDFLKQSRPVTIQVENATLQEVLDRCFSSQPLTYDIVDNTIIIKPKDKAVQQKVKSLLNIPLNIKGKVTDTAGRALPGAVIKVKGTDKAATTNDKGEFEIRGVEPDAVLVISYIGYVTLDVAVSEMADGLVKVILKPNIAQLESVSIVSTGYQEIPKERATGSFVQIDNKLLNRSVSTNILDRLDGITSGLIFNKNQNGSASTSSPITIRGTSTIYANQNPLVVIDNFPYNGDLSAINPNDIASITVLKDAAAASIWGAFSGNGVIVITTKKGRYNQPPKVEINSNVTIGAKPNLFYAPQISSENYIGVEDYLFKQGYYDFALTSTSFPSVSPVVDMLDRRRSNLITSGDSAAFINRYKGQDGRYDISKYLYRTSVNQQYNVNITGGGTGNIYYFSAGFDRNLNNVNRNDFNRISINGSNTYTFLNQKLELYTSVYYTKSKTDNNGLTSSGSQLPYITLKDANGNNTVVPTSYRQSYIDTAGHGNLLDWNYRQLDELRLNNNHSTLNEYRINTSLTYKILNGLNAVIQYQYDQGNSNGQTLYDPQSFYTRTLINQYTQYDASTDTYTRPIPTGGILDKSYQTFTSQNARGQLNYSHDWNSVHNISFLAGFEVRDVSTDYSTSRVYGYDDLGSVAPIDYKTIYLLTPSYNSGTIPSGQSFLRTTNRFISYFSNIAYTYKDRYIVSASARKDESNIFGVRTNQKGVPLWSAGASWDLFKENFYHIGWLPYLRIRISNGYQGNVDNTLSSLVTASTNSSLVNSYLQPVSVLSNPPNPDLRWEKVNTTNFGVDFRVKSFLSGTLEYYIKQGSDLIGISAVDPTTGTSTFKGNSADMAGKGIDITLTSQNLKGKLQWSSTFLLSYTQNRVTKYLLKPAMVSAAFDGLNPVEGNPLYSVYSFKWAGLDAAGDPQVYFDGKVSKDYSAIYNAADFSNLKYEGSATPTLFGSFRNDFTWNRLTLSANIVYKFGYYYRRPSVNYSSLFGGTTYMPDQDFRNRWQSPGDEARTFIPALIYPGDGLRDAVFNRSSVLIDKGDHIRLQDISIGYDIDKKQFPGLPFSMVRIYGYVNNIGIIWRANKNDIDPDYIPTGGMVYPNPKTFALGLKITL